MQANWSLILNVLLLIGVVIAIGRLMKARRQNFTASAVNYPPVLGKTEGKFFDDIIAVRKIPQEFVDEIKITSEPIAESVSPLTFVEEPEDTELVEDALNESPSEKNEQGQSLMMFLLAKENRTLAGYELLQTVLAAGLRFGEGQLFHRHQYPNGQGPVLCSLAAATASGVFDLQNIGAFSARGLCLFMQSCGNPTIDADRFKIMLDTAKQLSDDLDTLLLDDRQRPMTQDSLANYCRLLNIPNPVTNTKSTERV